MAGRLVGCSAHDLRKIELLPEQRGRTPRPVRMTGLKLQERTTIEAVARRFSATWEKRSDPPGAYIMVAGKPNAFDRPTLPRPRTGQGNGGKPGLRLDKGPKKFIERL